MIKALLLIFFPIPTWERIALARQKWSAILLVYVLPLVVMVSAAEGYSLVRWPRPRGIIGRSEPVPFARGEVIVFETAQVFLSAIVVFVMARLIKSLGETFHGRHTFTQAFTVAAFGMGPLFLLRFLNVIPGLSPWVSWAIGLVLAVMILYHGLPRVMLPDPPHAFGLFLMTILMLTMVTGLVCFVTDWYLRGEFPKLDHLVSRIAAMLHL